MGKKIIIVGSPGAGKSTFARKLRDMTGLPLYYLDMLFHRADRTTASREEFDERLKKIVEQDEWIIDGNYQRTLPLRFEMCTDVFLFDLPQEECLAGAASRIGQVREDMPWVEQEFDEEFRQYIIDFPQDQLHKIYSLAAQYKDKRNITIFRSREDSEEWIMKQGLERFIFKEGKGTADNASDWKVCMDTSAGRYTAQLSFGGAGGASYSLYEIDRETFDLVGTFEDDDHRSERLIRERGRKLYESRFDRNTPGSDDVYDKSYRELCSWADIKSFAE